MHKSRWMIALVGIMAATMLFVTACTPGDVSPTPTQPTGPENTEVIEWLGQVHTGGITQQYESLVRVADRIGSLSDGRLNMRVEIGGGIAPSTQEWPAVDVGTLDFAITCWMFLRDRNESAALFTTIAGGMKPMEALAWNNDGDGFLLAQEMIESIGLNVHAVKNGGWMGPPEIFVSTNRPLTKAGDFNGMTIRGAGDTAEIWSKLGASMVFIPPGEVYEAMERGVIDGYEVSMPTLDWAFGLYEAADYLYLSGARQPYEYNPFIVNGTTWAALPDDLKEIVTEVNQAETIRSYTNLLKIDIEALQKFRDYGCNVEYLPDALIDEYSAAADVFYAEAAANNEFSKRVLDSYWAFMEDVQSTWPGGV